jgi:hypothetical protein
MPNYELRVPIFCPVCSGLMKGKSTNSYYNFGCCVDCQIYFLEDRPATIEKWKNGWRPSPEEIERMREAFKNGDS